MDLEAVQEHAKIGSKELEEMKVEKPSKRSDKVSTEERSEDKWQNYCRVYKRNGAGKRHQKEMILSEKWITI